MLLGENIRKIRNLKGLSQSEIERRTSLKREYLSKIENSDLKNPTYFTLVKLAKGLGVELAEIINPDYIKTSRAVDMGDHVAVGVWGKNALIENVNFCDNPFGDVMIPKELLTLSETKDLRCCQDGQGFIVFDCSKLDAGGGDMVCKVTIEGKKTILVGMLTNDNDTLIFNPYQQDKCFASVVKKKSDVLGRVVCKISGN